MIEEPNRQLVLQSGACICRIVVHESLVARRWDAGHQFEEKITCLKQEPGQYQSFVGRYPKISASFGERCESSPNNHQPARGIETSMFWHLAGDVAGPNNHQPARGIETVVLESTLDTADKVRTTINPPEGLKPIISHVADALRGAALVRTTINPPEGLKRMSASHGTRRRPNNHQPARGIETSTRTSALSRKSEQPSTRPRD